MLRDAIEIRERGLSFFFTCITFQRYIELSQVLGDQDITNTPFPWYKRASITSTLSVKCKLW